KIDLTTEQPALQQEQDQTVINISIKTSQGIDLLKNFLKEFVGFNQQATGNFLARRRHLDALERCLNAVTVGQAQLSEHRAGELLAEDLRQAQQALGEITGEVTADDLLGTIFSQFCIGK
nr:tRNA uridine-5-carboxymethylaminomethyl(34) synthesis GTPase MnmE [Gammaproteobacteria bacterium]